MSHDRDPDDEDTDRRRPTPAERRQRALSYPYGVPAIRLADDPPDDADELPFDWADEPGRLDADGLRRAGRDPATPVAPAELSAIIRQMAKRMRAEFSALLTQAPLDVAERVEKRIAALEKDFEPHKRFGKWVAGGAFAAVIAVIVFVYDRGKSEQHVADELQRLGALVDKLERKIDQQTGIRP